MIKILSFDVFLPEEILAENEVSVIGIGIAIVGGGVGGLFL